MFAWTFFVTLIAAGSAYVVTGASPSVPAAATVLDTGNNAVNSLANLAAAPSNSALALNNTVTSIVNNTAASIVNNTAAVINSTSASIVNNTDISIVNNTATSINSAASSIANNTVADPAAAENPQVVVQVIVIQIISFFVYVESLGGPPPSVLSSGNSDAPFVVLDIVFINLSFAAFHVCAVQLNVCIIAVNSGGASFSAVDCFDQHSRCKKVASTATPQASTPATLAATATIVNPVSSTSTLSTNSGVGDNLAILNPGEPSAACLPTTVTVSLCTATEFVTLPLNAAASAGFGTASAGWNGLGVHHKAAHTGVRKGGKGGD